MRVRAISVFLRNQSQHNWSLEDSDFVLVLFFFFFVIVVVFFVRLRKPSAFTSTSRSGLLSIFFLQFVNATSVR